MSYKKIIKVMLVDDHAIIRHGLRSSLEKEDDISVIAEAGDGRSAVKLASKLCPDVVIMDINMPDLNGVEATRQILADNATIKIIGLSMYGDHANVIGMLNAGTSGFVLKSCAFKELSDSIYAVCQGKRYLSPDIAGVVVDTALNPSAQQDETSEHLTPREREILQLIAEGKKSNEMAEALGISKRTVDIHRKNIMDKLNIRSIAELTKYAIREGITFLY